MNTIYKPKGRAGEYAEYALNIYTGCNHGCTYCYAAGTARRFGKDFTAVAPRPGIYDATVVMLGKMQGMGKSIHLCFSCDPYPAPPADDSMTREIIKAIKASGNHVQILTKAGAQAQRDFDLLDAGDSFGVSVTGAGIPGTAWENAEPGAASLEERLAALRSAKRAGIKTWVSCEPILDGPAVLRLVREADYIDLYKFGKLNHMAVAFNWEKIGREIESICKARGLNYIIKEDLRKELEGNNDT